MCESISRHSTSVFYHFIMCWSVYHLSYYLFRKYLCADTLLLKRPSRAQYITPLRVLTHWGRVTHICVSKLTIIGSDNGLSPGRRQAIIWTNAGILLIRTLGTNFSEILSKIHAFSFKKMHLKMSSAKWRPFCLSLNVLNTLSSNGRKLLSEWHWLLVSEVSEGKYIEDRMTPGIKLLSVDKKQVLVAFRSRF